MLYSVTKALERGSSGREEKGGKLGPMLQRCLVQYSPRVSTDKPMEQSCLTQPECAMTFAISPQLPEFRKRAVVGEYPKGRETVAHR